MMGEALELELAGLAAGCGEPLRASVAHALAGGKRARGLLLLAAGERLGVPEEMLTRAAACVELLHAATLVQDDIFDSSCVRRGRPSVCCAFGSEIAILASDWMLAEAMRTAYALLPAFGNAIGCCAQAMMQAEARESVPCADRRLSALMEHATSVARGKTGSLFAVAMQASYLLAGRTGQAESVYACGVEVGVAFQYLDDVLDIYGDAATAGKELGHDQAACLVTMPLVDAVAPMDAELPSLREPGVDTVFRAADLQEPGMREHLLACARRRWQAAVLACSVAVAHPEGILQLLPWLMDEMLGAYPQWRREFKLPQGLPGHAAAGNAVADNGAALMDA